MLEVGGLPGAAEVRPPKQRLMTMKWLTKITKRESRPLTFGLQLKLSQVLQLLVLAILLSGPAAALEATIANSQLITLKDTGHETPESIYKALNLIRKPMKGGGDGSQR